MRPFSKVLPNLRSELPWWDNRVEVYYLLLHLLDTEKMDWDQDDVIYFLGSPRKWEDEYNKMIKGKK